MVVETLLKYKAAIIFYLLLAIIVYIYRKKFDFQAKIIALYRTKFGLKLMDTIANKYREWVKLYGLIGIGVGFVVIPFVTWLLIQSIIKIISEQFAYDGSPIVVPGVPLAGFGGVTFPLITGWICLAVIMIIHEFSHGVVARAHNVKVKSSGLAFFGPLLGAFVEPDEEELKKSTDVVQYSIFAAGPFSNLILTAVVLGIWYLLLFSIAGMATSVGVTTTVQPDGPLAQTGLEGTINITAINGTPTMNYTSLIEQITLAAPQTELVLTTDTGNHTMTLGAHPENPEVGYVGILGFTNIVKLNNDSIIYKGLYKSLLWLEQLCFWIWLISFMVGIMNLFPLFITDGAHMTRTACTTISPKNGTKWFMLINKLGFLLFLIVVFLPFVFNIANMMK